MKTKKANLDYHLKTAKPIFLKKIGLLAWEAAQWTQYKGYTFDEKSDVIHFHFETSTYEIRFDISIRAFSTIYGDPSDLFAGQFSYIYDHFKNLKYNEANCVK